MEVHEIRPRLEKVERAAVPEVWGAAAGAACWSDILDSAQDWKKTTENERFC
jgi:hypothetical protein